MVVIILHVGKNMVDNVLLDGRVRGECYNRFGNTR
jgi:hypothetical protein